MKFIPHKYQEYSIDYVLSHPICALLLSMGLGKSIIVLTALIELLAKRAIKRVLIIAPLRVARQSWPMEIMKWDHTRALSYAVAVGSDKERRKALQAGATITIINRENIPWLVDTYFGGEVTLWPFDCVIVDELQSFKNFKAKRYKALFSVRPFVSRIIGLTGTPGSLMDLWGEMRMLDQGQRLGRFITHYRDRWFEPDQWNRYTGQVYSYKPKPHAEKQIYDLISDITISMDAVSNLDMPEIFYQDTVVELSDAERSKYDRLRKDMALRLDEGTVTATTAGVLANKLRQCADGVVYDADGKTIKLHERKLDALEDIVEAAGEPVLVAYAFRHELEAIRGRFPEARVLDKDRDIADWNKGLVQIGLFHPSSLGMGVNLQQGGHILVWYGLTWSIVDYSQSVSRLWRQGQSRPVIVQHILCADTIDERVKTLLENKDDTQQSLLEAVRATLE